LYMIYTTQINKHKNITKNNKNSQMIEKNTA